MSPGEDANAAIRKELEAVPQKERLDYLAALPRPRQAEFIRILPRDDVKKLNQHIDRLVRKRNEPTLESWLAEARAGKASTPEAMVDVLRESFDRLKPQDAQWIQRIDETASAGGFSKRQKEVIRAIYARYFVA